MMGTGELEAKWQQNEVELNRIHAAPPLDREMRAKREEELLSEQARIDCGLGAHCGDGLSADFESFQSLHNSQPAESDQNFDAKPSPAF